MMKNNGMMKEDKILLLKIFNLIIIIFLMGCAIYNTTIPRGVAGTSEHLEHTSLIVLFIGLAYVFNKIINFICEAMQQYPYG